jgi:feruloyl esterase
MPYDTGIVVATGGLPGYLPTGRPGPFGPASRDLTIDVDARIQAIRADAGQRLTDTNIWTNLNSFTGHGGKILFYHGVSDPWFSAYDTLDYWQRAAEANGPAWADASRFYMVPGMGHCGGDTAFDKFDLLGGVVDWVETGKAPAAVLSKRTGPEPATRPMCPWPTYAHYTGGDPCKAESFSCRAATG